MFSLRRLGVNVKICREFREFRYDRDEDIDNLQSPPMKSTSVVVVGRTYFFKCCSSGSTLTRWILVAKNDRLMESAIERVVGPGGGRRVGSRLRGMRRVMGGGSGILVDDVAEDVVGVGVVDDVLFLAGRVDGDAALGVVQ